MAKTTKRRKRSLGNTMKSYPDQFFEYVIPNTKALKNWLIFEHFHFFTLKFRLLRCRLFLNIKESKTLSLGSRTSSRRSNNFICLFLLSIKAKKIGPKIKNFHFFTEFSTILLRYG